MTIQDWASVASWDPIEQEEIDKMFLQPDPAKSPWYGIAAKDVLEEDKKRIDFMFLGDQGFFTFDLAANTAGAATGGTFWRVLSTAAGVFSFGDAVGDLSDEGYKEDVDEEKTMIVDYYMDQVMQPTKGTSLTEEMVNEHGALKWLAPFMFPNDHSGEGKGTLEFKQGMHGLYPQLDVLTWYLLCPMYGPHYTEQDSFLNRFGWTNNDGGRIEINVWNEEEQKYEKKTSKWSKDLLADDAKAMKRLYPQIFHKGGKHPKGLPSMNWLRIRLKSLARTAPTFAIPSFEQEKLAYMNEMLRELGTKMLRNQRFREKFGLGELMIDELVNADIPHLLCYPDLDLPDHPYYPKHMNACNPDFYMHSIYEDAPGGLKGAIRKEIRKRLMPAIQGPYNHLKKMQGQGITKYDDLFGKDFMEVIARNPSEGFRLSKMVHHPEGTDSLDYMDPTAVPEDNWPKNERLQEWFTRSRRPAWKATLGRTRFPLAGAGDEVTYGGEVVTVEGFETQYSWNPHMGRQEMGMKERTWKAFVQKANLKQAKELKNQIEAINKEIKNFDTKNTKGKKASEKLAKELMTLQSDKHDSQGNKKGKKKAGRSKYSSVRGWSGAIPALSCTDWNIQYKNSMRADWEIYKKLTQKMGDIETMMGSTAGFVGESLDAEAATELRESLDDTSITTLDHFTHAFGPGELAKLAEDSAADILSEKLTMRRAYPTFKLFFVEQDEHESRWLNFDDFYTFNAVKEFSIHKSRKNPADTATIILQNVSGTLDGTKRGLTTDLDYFQTRTAEKDASKKRQSMEDASTGMSMQGGPGPSWKSDSRGQEIDEANYKRRQWVKDRDMPFGSVVLRTGMNVQLRCGYSNDPNQLEVMLSGRVTDISWGKQGDLVEIVVQSFGAELAQLIKGGNTNSGDDNLISKQFPTTHHLLGSLMLSGELKHFGRWEYGRLKLRGEEKDHTLDFTEYDRDAPFGMDFTTGFARWVKNNYGAALMLATAGYAITFLPWGRAVGGMARLVGVGRAAPAATRTAAATGGGRAAGVADDIADDIIDMGADGLWRASPGGILMPVGGRTAAGAADDVAVSAASVADDILMTEAASNVSNLGSWALGAWAAGTSWVQKTASSTARWFGRGRAGLDAAPRLTAQTEAQIMAMAANGEREALKAFIFNTGTTAAGQGLGFRMLGRVKSLWPWSRGGSGFYGEAGVAIEAGLNSALNAGVINGQRVIQLLHQAQLNAHTHTFGYLAGMAAGAGGVVVQGGGAIMAGGAPVFMAGMAGLAMRSPGLAMRGSMIVGTGLVAADLVYNTIVNPLVQMTYGKLKRKYTKMKAYMRLHPADDNLFPPGPAAYMHPKPNLAGEIQKVITGTIGFGWFLLTFGSDDQMAERLNSAISMWSGSPAEIFNKKLTMTQAKYTLNNTTIWKVFHEMSLRHPGWIYAARPYGNKFEYRMFFGIPSQRWWARPMEAATISRLNYIRRQFDPTEGIFSEDMITPTIYKKLYGSTAYSELVADNEKWANEQQYDLLHEYLYENPAYVLGEGYADQVEQTRDKLIYAGLRKSGPMSFDERDKLSQEAQAIAKKVSKDMAEKRVKIQMMNRALSEYLTGLKSRFEPFRRYHIVDSEYDLVANNIISSEHNVVNAVNVTYYKDDIDNQPASSVVLKAATNIPEEMIRMGQVNYPNCKGYKNALRYGMGSLIHTMKEMYRGEILVLGNARIRPWDICILRDTYNDMCGPLEVEAVTHLFSHETGFLTEIKPGALVFANEISTWPILEGLKLFSMAVQDHREGKGNIDAGSTWAGYAGAWVGQDGLDSETVIRNWTWHDEKNEQLWQAHLEERYGRIFQDGFDISTIFPLQGGGAFAPDQKGGTGLQSSDVNFRAPYVSPFRQQGDTYLSTAIAALGTVTAGMLAYGMFKRIGFGLQGLASKSAVDTGNSAVKALVGGATKADAARWGRALGIPAGAFGAALGSNFGELFRLENMYNGSALSWFVAGHILFNKCMEEETICVVPLMKGSRPIVSGLGVRDPLMAWRSVLGKVSNVVKDTIDGSGDVIDEWYSFGNEIWRMYGNKQFMDQL